MKVCLGKLAPDEHASAAAGFPAFQSRRNGRGKAFKERSKPAETVDPLDAKSSGGEEFRKPLGIEKRQVLVAPHSGSEPKQVEGPFNQRPCRIVVGSA